MKTAIKLLITLFVIASFTSCNKDESETDSKIKDIDGNVYHSVTIGTQVWMVENLKATKYNDGTEIAWAFDADGWKANTTGAYCWYDNIEAVNKDTYGALYNQQAVRSGKLAPKGWHVSTDEDWAVLNQYLGGDSIAGGKLKETGITHWIDPNTGATNETGFTALPGGGRGKSGGDNIIGFGGINWMGVWWSPSEQDISPDYMYAHGMRCDTKEVHKYGSDIKSYTGYSVRCVKDK
jgi:uncharacterized protein (TIGR02145 family)